MSAYAFLVIHRSNSVMQTSVREGGGGTIFANILGKYIVVIELNMKTDSILVPAQTAVR